MAGRAVNLLTVDLEEWFVVEALAGHVSRDDWPQLPSTLVANTHRLLDLFARRDVRATWFVLGWCAEKYPDLIHEIASAGHEIACHSYAHVRVDQMEKQDFINDTRRAVNAIISACGIRPIGYRAPSWSINGSVTWAFEVLSDLGFVYDSSIFPIKHDLYGMPEAPRKLFRMELNNGRKLYELPASTLRVLGYNLPGVGGGYLRHAPLWYSRLMIRKLNAQGIPAVMYVHPWEVDPDPPRLSGLNPVQRYRSLGSTRVFGYKLDRLLAEFSFLAITEYLETENRRTIGFESRR